MRLTVKLGLGVIVSACLAAVNTTMAADETKPEKIEVLVRPGALVPKNARTVFTELGGQKSVVTVTNYTKKAELLSVGPFDVDVIPADGLPVRAVEKWKPAAELKLSEYLGSVFVRGDDLPRSSVVLVVPVDDPGPDEKGHKPVQRAKEYKTTMVVPPGFYAVWIKPDNGARAQKIADKIRVLAGRETNVPETE